VRDILFGGIPCLVSGRECCILKDYLTFFTEVFFYAEDDPIRRGAHRPDNRLDWTLIKVN